MVSCVVGVWLGCIGVILTTVRESATPEKVPRLSLIFCAARCCVFVNRQSVKVYLHMTCTTGMFSRTLLYAQHPVTKNLHISPRFSLTIFYRDASLVLLRAHLCTAVDYAQNPVFEIVHQASMKVCLHIVQRECSAEPSMRSILRR